MSIAPDFKINSVSLPSPTKHKWIIPESTGENGIGQKKYTPFFTYEIRYDELTQEEYFIVLNTWKGHYGSGTAVVRLPQQDGSTYGFVNYSGTIDRPVVGDYKENYVSDVTITIRRIGVG